MDLLTAEEKRDYKAAFELVDKKNRGYLRADQLVLVLRCLGFNPSDQELQDLVTEIDLDRNGKFDANEFIMLAVCLDSRQKQEIAGITTMSI